MSSEAKTKPGKPVKVFVYCDEDVTPPNQGYDVVLRATVGESVWQQIEELLDLGGLLGKYPLEFVVQGVLGFRQNVFARELTDHGPVRWIVPEKSVKALTETFRGYTLKHPITVAS